MNFNVKFNISFYEKNTTLEYISVWELTLTCNIDSSFLLLIILFFYNMCFHWIEVFFKLAVSL